MISRKSSVQILMVVLLIIVINAHYNTHNKKQINDKINSIQIMYGSTIRIKASPFNYYLHSHLVNYPLGSGLQSVTGFPLDNDYNSLWTIKEAHGDYVKTYQQYVKCGDTVRLEHALTKKNLHSQEIYQSMITKGQQVSAHGRQGHGNQNDNWVMKCLRKKDGDNFTGVDEFELIHENTQKRLKMSKYYQYSFGNWDNCPFQGQIEVSGSDKSTRETQFKIIGGVFFREAEQENKEEQNPTDQDL